MLQGKGVFIWTVRDCVDNYDAPALAAICKDLGCTHVEVKIIDGLTNYNQRQIKTAGIVVGYKDDLMKPLVDAFHAAGIQIGGFSAPYPNLSLSAQGQMFAKRLEDNGFDYGVVDAEGSWEIGGASTAAIAYMNAVRALTKKEMYLTSFRFPSVHKMFPFSAFMALCDFWMPQVYWVGSHNAGQQLRQCIDQLMAISAKPIIPVGAAYSENGWRPTIDEMNDFEAAVHDLGLPGNTWWELDKGSGILRFPDMYSAIKAHKWAIGQSPEPTQVLSLESLDARLKAIEEKLGL